MISSSSSSNSKNMIKKNYKVEWIDLSKEGSLIIPPRSGHAAFTIDDDVYVFGGYAEEKTQSQETGETKYDRYATNDMWKWNNDKCSWTKTETANEPPQQRLAGAAASLGENAFIFGGWDPQNEGTGGVIL